MAKRIKTEKRYMVEFCTSNGDCYHTKFNCPYSYVKECRRTAKALGEKIKVEHTHTIQLDYSY